MGRLTALPTTSCPGQYFLAIAALMIATGCDVAVSLSRKARPAMIGVPTAEKYPDEAMVYAASNGT